LLFQDGAILAWKFNVAANCFEPAASLKGHTRGVVSLVVGANRLYSGSMDNTIRVSLHKLSSISISFIFFYTNVEVGIVLLILILIYLFHLVVTFRCGTLKLCSVYRH
jgi:hypothetical protein